VEKGPVDDGRPEEREMGYETDRHSETRLRGDIEGFEEERDDHDYSVYTGTGGISKYMYHVLLIL